MKVGKGEGDCEDGLEEAGDVNDDWLWTSVLGAVKQKLLNFTRRIECLLYLNIFCWNVLTSFFPGSHQFSCLNWSQD